MRLCSAALLTLACAPIPVPGACLLPEPQAWHEDLDGDGFGDPRTATWDYCPSHPTRIARGGDCDDQDPAVHPDATERFYDGRDQDCDGLSDHDQDLDGHDTLASGGDDCDDLDPSAHVGAPERWYDDLDQACDGGDDHDQDADGHPRPPRGDDCDDTAPSAFPGAQELPDGRDNDCNGVTDDVTLLLTTSDQLHSGAFDGAVAPLDLGDGAVGTVPTGGPLWPLRSTTPMLVPMSSVGITATRGSVYVVGGASGFGSTGGEMLVARAAVLPDSTLADWELLEPLPDPSASHSTVTDGHCLVAVAGTSPATGTVGATWTAALRPDGTIEPWRVQPGYPLGVAQSRGVYLRGWIYVTGGIVQNASTAAVYRARLRADCSIDGWLPERNLPTPMSYHLALTERGQLYVLGGTTVGVWRATPGDDGGLSAWEPQPSLPGVLWASAGAVLNGELLVVGGDYDGETTALIHRAPLYDDGTVGAWTLAEHELPEARRLQTATVWDQRAYVVGGWTGNDPTSVQRTDTVVVLGLDTRGATTYRPQAHYQARFDLTQERGLVALDWTLTAAPTGSVRWLLRTADASGVFSSWSALTGPAPIALPGSAAWVDVRAELSDPTGAQVVLEQVQLSHR